MPGAQLNWPLAEEKSFPFSSTCTDCAPLISLHSSLFHLASYLKRYRQLLSSHPSNSPPLFSPFPSPSAFSPAPFSLLWLLIFLIITPFLTPSSSHAHHPAPIVLDSFKPYTYIYPLMKLKRSQKLPLLLSFLLQMIF